MKEYKIRIFRFSKTIILLFFCIFVLFFSACKDSNLDSSDIDISITSGLIFVKDDCRKSVSRVEIPQRFNGVSVKGIANNGFYECTNLREVKISNGMTYIGNQAFLDCSMLISVYIPKSVTKIESYAFKNCYKLKSIYYAGTEIQWNNISKGTDWQNSNPNVEFNVAY